MKSEIVSMEIFTCEYCGLKLTDKHSMQYHESICPNNPRNQPCSTCNNCLVDPLQGIARCKHNIDINSVGGNILCFFFDKGSPKIDLQLPEEIPDDNNPEE